MRSMLAIEYGYVRVYAYSVALQAITERRIRDLDSRNTESQVISEQEIADNEHLRQITAAARSILRTVVYDLVGSVAYIPVRTYSRILAGSLCLLKVSAALGPSCTFHSTSINSHRDMCNRYQQNRSRHLSRNGRCCRRSSAELGNR